MSNYESSRPTVTNCTFTSNLAGGNGGGMSNDHYSSSVVSNCTFISNSADGAYGLGGGMYNEHSSPTVTDCTFSGNSAYDSGGGMCNYFNGGPEVTNCTFRGNSAGYEDLTGYGGGMANYYHSNPIVTGCTFTGNSADFAGGMYNYDYSNTTVTGCTFTGNSAESVFFFGGNGGGMNNEGSSSPTVTNCIIWGNTASSGGNEIYNNYDSYDPSTPVISYCDIAGSGGSGSWDSNLGTDDGGNIDVDPLFADPNGPDGIVGTEDDNLRLLLFSPCIDVGDNSVVDANCPDLDGNPRIINGIVDMGAYEALLPIEADVHIVPRAINRNNRLKRVMAIIRLPAGISKRDVADEPFMLYPDDNTTDSIEAIWQRVISRGHMTRVFAMFNKDELMDVVSNNGKVELTVVGKLESGQYILGSGTVRIIQPRRRRQGWLRRRW
jgi:parallel beta-helix repeat protein